MIVSKHRLRDADASGPLKSIFSLSNGAVDLMKVPAGDLQNCGFGFGTDWTTNSDSLHHRQGAVGFRFSQSEVCVRQPNGTWICAVLSAIPDMYSSNRSFRIVRRPPHYHDPVSR